jgi:hypothetical protein
LLDYCLQNFPPIESDDKLAKMRLVRERARARISELELTCDCSGAELFVDDNAVGTLPLTKPLYVQPGRHQLSLRRGGIEFGSKVEVEALAGQRVAVEVATQTREAVAPPQLRQPIPTVDADEAGSPSWPLYVGGGLVALNVAAAIGFKVASGDASERADTLRGKLGDPASVCSNGTSSSLSLSCSQFSDAISDRDHYSRLFTYTIGAAATFAIATTAYWIWSKPATRSTQRTGMTEKTASLAWVLSGDSKSAYLIAVGRL